jgi:hypothetical protein
MATMISTSVKAARVKAVGSWLQAASPPPLARGLIRNSQFAIRNFICG